MSSQMPPRGLKVPGLKWLAARFGWTPAPEAPLLVQRDPTDASVGTGNFTQGVPAFWFARSLDYGATESLFNPYANSPWVQRAIKQVAGPIAGLDVVFHSAQPSLGASAAARCAMADRTAGAQPSLGELRRARARRLYGARGVVRRSASEELDLPQVRAWMREPMPGLAWSDFVEASVGWLKISECFWLLSDETLVPFPEARGSLPQVIVARPDRMRPVIDRDRGNERAGLSPIVGWEYTDSQGGSWNLLPEQVIHFRGWNPYNEYRGLGEYQSAHLAAEADWLAGKFARNLMGANGDTGPYIVAKSGVPTDAQREQIIMSLKEKRRATLRGEFKPVFMTGDIAVEDPRIKTVDQSFLGQRLENRHEVAVAFGVPPSLFDVKASYSIGSASDYFQLILNTCIPTGAKFCDALERLLQRAGGLALEAALDWDEHPVMQQVRRERFDAIPKLWSVGMPMKQINDVLGLEVEPYEGWEIGYLPINVMPAAEAEGPGPAPQEFDEAPSASAGSFRSAFADGYGATSATSATDDEIEKMIAALERKASMKNSNSRNQKLWQAHMRARSGTVKAIRGKVNRALNAARQKALAKLNQLAGRAGGAPALPRPLSDAIFDAPAFGRELFVSVSPLLEAALQKAADDLRLEIAATGPWKFPPAKAVEYLRGRKPDIVGVGCTVRGQLNTALEEGIAAGQSVEELMDRARSVFNRLSKSEALRVAMTETASCFSFARHEACVGAGVKYKAWLSSRGPNVRPAHEAAESAYGLKGSEGPIPLDEPFEVGGEKLMHPCDRSGGGTNVINCQCVEVPVRPTKGAKGE